MSRLYDSVVHKSNIDLNTQANIGEKWYIAKPIRLFGWIGFKRRFRDALKVLRGRAFAVHHAEDSTETHW